jgi:hypothetical protein
MSRTQSAPGRKLILLATAASTSRRDAERRLSEFSSRLLTLPDKERRRIGFGLRDNTPCRGNLGVKLWSPIVSHGFDSQAQARPATALVRTRQSDAGRL